MRYADDFVVLTKSQAKVREAHDLVLQHLASLGLTLSAEKTKMTTFRQGFAFLGFDIAAWSVKMRPKSVEKFKDKIRELTPRHHNLDAKTVNKINQVVRGTANYFDTDFSHCRNLFRTLDRWMRMRIRCMKFKRKRITDNWRMRLKHLRNQGLLFLGEIRAPPAKECEGSPQHSGQQLWRRPVPERGSPVNMGNRPHRDNGEGEEWPSPSAQEDAGECGEHGTQPKIRGLTMMKSDPFRAEPGP